MGQFVPYRALALFVFLLCLRSGFAFTIEFFPDTAQYNTYVKGWEEKKATDYAAALDLSRNAYSVALQLGDSGRIVKSLKMIAYSLEDLGDHRQVIGLLIRAVRIAENNLERYPDLKQLRQSLYNNLGISYMYRGMNDSALYYNFKSLELRLEEGDVKKISTAYNNMGVIYFGAYMYKPAKEYYLKALDLKASIKDESNLTLIYHNLGYVYYIEEDYNEALSWYTKSLARCPGGCSSTDSIKIYYGLGVINTTLKAYSEARKYLEISEECAMRTQNTYLSSVLVALSNVARETGDLDTSLDLAKKSLYYAYKHQNTNSVSLGYYSLIKTYGIRNDLTNENFYLKRYTDLRDSIWNGEIQNNIAKFQTNFTQLQNEKTILVINENIALKNRQLLYTGTIIFLILFIAGGLIWANRRLKLSNDQLDIKVKHRTKDLILTSHNLQKINQEMNDFLYKTSHDIRGPLASLKGLCTIAQMNTKEDQTKGFLTNINDTSDRLTTILNRISIVNTIAHSEPVPVPIDVALLIRTIADKYLFQDGNTDIKLSINVTAIRPVITDTDLLSMAIENIIENAVLYKTTTQPPVISVTVADKNPDYTIIEFKDNGPGIKEELHQKVFEMLNRSTANTKRGGMGLFLSRKAIEKLGGELILQSSTSKGSVFQIRIPSNYLSVIRANTSSPTQLAEELEVQTKTKEGPSFPFFSY